MRLEGVTREGRLWRLEYTHHDHARYSYYGIEKFPDELAIYKWWKEQTEDDTNYGKSRA